MEIMDKTTHETRSFKMVAEGNSKQAFVPYKKITVLSIVTAGYF